MPRHQPPPQLPRSGGTSASAQLPKNWPREITYLTTLHVPPPLSSSLLQVPSNSNSNSNPKPNPVPSLPIIKPNAVVSPNHLVRITPITSPAHPAHGQYGLCATRALAPSSFIILYLGTLHGPATPSSRTQSSVSSLPSCSTPSTTSDPTHATSTSDPTHATSTSDPTHATSNYDPTHATSNYDLSLDRDLGLAIDASRCGNEARFINDYRGIRAAGPNAEFRDCLVQVGPGPGRLEKRIGVFVLSPGKAGGPRAKGIAKGEEIVVSYGKGFWNARREG
ncbi:hypothetical protein A1O3_00746 [Capronia epimyces CBS 606.96]|uniref:SET domain-containing protein n=1 Tax=Capronia epimyces CBS 606.96 TaxID=1182542 RepID=W9YSF4_9EURO|nr:uncharacterized protein A1O3_00746 [Capronia epimyces CBS 606.96]EXJ92196.1 hypothetical protein A1O3_00746 [Capronia epimyces CBS 606.96]